MKGKTLFKAVILAFLTILTQSCEKDDSTGKEKESTVDSIAKKFLLNNFSYYYYWNREVNDRNASIKPDGLGVETYFDKLLYSGDRWSWMCDADDYISSQTGVFNGSWGISFGQTAGDDGDYSIKVKYIYPGSPLCQYGVTRGARLDAIDGVSLSPFTEEKRDYFNDCIDRKNSLSFSFSLENGEHVTFTESKAATLATSPVLKYGSIGPDDFNGIEENVGYLAYLGFKSNFNDELSYALESIRKSGARKLILDLRYNSGGDISSLDTLISFIAPPETVGENYLTIHHNDDISKTMDKSYDVKENSGNLALEDIYIITGKGSASASEIAINALKPFYGGRLHLVGKTSYGKPGGMYVMLFPGSDENYSRYENGDYSDLIYAFLPICFYNINSKGEMIPDSGFAPDFVCMDDLYHDFGVDELNIKACLTHIATGSFPKTRQTPRTTGPVWNGALIFNEWDIVGYGTAIAE